MMQEKGLEPQQIKSGEETLSPAQNQVVWPVASHYAKCTILIMLVIQFWLDCFSLQSLITKLTRYTTNSTKQNKKKQKQYSHCNKYY
jgi:hypothetical protein